MKVAETAIPRPHARKVNRVESSIRISSTSLPTSSATQNMEPAPQTVKAKKSVNQAAPVAVMLVAPTAIMVTNPSGPSNYSTVSHVMSANASTGRRSLEAPVEGPSGTQSATAVIEKLVTPSRDFKCLGAIDPALFSDSGLTKASFDAEHGKAESTYEQPPTSSLVSPPPSFHDDMGGSPIIEEDSTDSSPSSRQGSHQPKEFFQRCTPESGSMRRTTCSLDEGGLAEEGSEPPATNVEAPILRDESSKFIITADEESLKLIKELQAQDLGLRRRIKP